MTVPPGGVPAGGSLINPPSLSARSKALQSSSARSCKGNIEIKMKKTTIEGRKSFACFFMLVTPGLISFLFLCAPKRRRHSP